jgi:hypothetical protein
MINRKRVPQSGNQGRRVVEGQPGIGEFRPAQNDNPPQVPYPGILWISAPRADSFFSIC